MQDGDFVLIDFVGRIKDTGKVFDSTLTDVAKKENVYNEKICYKPIVVIVGSGLVIKGLEEAVKGMKVGEKKTVEVAPEKAFGERKTDYIKLIPLSNFSDQDVDPKPGSFVTIGNITGKILSIDGGRVNVDFNHPLAGKALEYEIEVKSEIKDVGEKIKSIINYYVTIENADIDLSVAGKDAEISFKKKFDINAQTRESIANTALKWISDVEKIKFSDVYVR